MNLFGFLSGSLLKKRIIKKKENNIYLIFPRYNGVLSFYGILYANCYLHETSADRVVIVTTDMRIKDSAEKMLACKHRIFLLKENEMDNLISNLAFHSDLMGHSTVKNLFYISDTYPYGLSIKTLYDGGIFAPEYIVWNRIFHKNCIYYAEKPIISKNFDNIYKLFLN